MNRSTAATLTMFLALVYTPLSAGATCTPLLTGILYESAREYSPLRWLKLDELVRNDTRLEFALRHGPARTCVGGCSLWTGSWRVRYEPKANPERRWALDEARNYQVFSGPDPVYESVAATIEQSVANESIPAPDFRDDSDLADDCDSSAALSADPVAARFLDPMVIQDMVTLVTANAYRVTTVTVPSLSFDEALRDLVRRGDIPMYLARNAFPRDSKVMISVDSGSEDGSNRILLNDSFGLDVELTFRKGMAFSSIESVRVTRQVRRAITQLTYTLAAGHLDTAASKYTEILERKRVERLAKIQLEELKREAATDASDGLYLDQNPELLGRKNYGAKVKVFRVNGDALQKTRSAIEFRMADAIRPQVLYFDNVAFAISYLKSGILLAEMIGASEQDYRGMQISGTYEKTPESVRLRDGSEAIVTMLDVTLHADTRHVFDRVQGLRKGQRQ